jgi:hypothetical protein
LGNFALAVIRVPIVVVARWLISDWRRARRRARFIAQQRPDWSVAAIVARIGQERADEAAAWPEDDPDATEVRPVASDPFVGTKREDEF